MPVVQFVALDFGQGAGSRSQLQRDIGLRGFLQGGRFLVCLCVCGLPSRWRVVLLDSFIALLGVGIYFDLKTYSTSVGGALEKYNHVNICQYSVLTVSLPSASSPAIERSKGVCCAPVRWKPERSRSGENGRRARYYEPSA